jgi:hypothetical protein
MGLLSLLVLANDNVGSRGAVSPAATSLRLSRREILLPDAGNRRDDVVALTSMVKDKTFFL